MISWSSATSTRMVTGRAARGSTAVTVQPPVRRGAGLEGAAEQRRPFGHPDQPVARRRRWAERAGVAVVAHRQPDRSRVAGDARPRCGSRGGRGARALVIDSWARR